MLRLSFVSLVVCLLLPAARAEDTAVPGTRPDGQAIYNFRCYFCHGYSGDAHTLAAEMLQPRPRDFTAATAQALSRERMLDAVRNGRPDTAMKPFATLLTAQEIEAVVDFVRDAFIRRGDPNTRYHTPENGWPDHERFAAAFAFARGEIPIDTDESGLDGDQRAGRRLYMRSCISCHDTPRGAQGRSIWENEAVSYPRTGFAPGDFEQPPDAFSGATSFARHDRVPAMADASAAERRGESLFQGNCAFCHAADGTGKNWIGTFMQPHPRDLSDTTQMRGMTRTRLRQAITAGIPGTSMPAWGGVLDAGQVGDIIDYIDHMFYPLAD